ncbi:hypothetical protein SAMN05192543_1091, partial [Paraburkholderia megapolitana]
MRPVISAAVNAKTPLVEGGVLSCSMRSLTITYFHTGNP